MGRETGRYWEVLGSTFRFLLTIVDCKVEFREAQRVESRQKQYYPTC